MTRKDLRPNNSRGMDLDVVVFPKLVALCHGYLGLVDGGWVWWD